MIGVLNEGKDRAPFTLFNRAGVNQASSGAVTGWCTFADLYRVVAMMLTPGSRIVEVGTFRGQSAIEMCFALLLTGKDKSIRFDVVDNFTGSLDLPEGEEKDMSLLFQKNLQRCRVLDMVRVHRMGSVEAAEKFDDGSLSFIFIDASHLYDSVQADLAAWRPKLQENGLIAGHDINCESVQLAVLEAFGGDSMVFKWCNSWGYFPDPRIAKFFLDGTGWLERGGVCAVQDLQKGSPVGGAEEDGEGHRHSPVEGEGCRTAAGVVRG